MNKRHREREKRMHHQHPDPGAVDRRGLLGGAWAGSVRKQSTAVLAGAETALPCKQRGTANPQPAGHLSGAAPLCVLRARCLKD